MNPVLPRSRHLALVLLAAALALPLLAGSPAPRAAAGPVASGEFRVNTTTADTQYQPAVAMDADGDYVITWASYGQDGSGAGVYAQRYSASGIPRGVETRVNTFTTNHQYEPAVAMGADGDYVITWTSDFQDGSGQGVYAQRYDAVGTPQGTETRVNTATALSQSRPSVAMDADGDYVITWQSDEASGGVDIYAQRYDAAGAPQGTETRVNSFDTSTQYDPAVAMDADGDYVITWTSYNQDGGWLGIYAQRFSAAGTPRGVETRVNTTTAEAQSEPSVAMDADGDYIITWTSNLQDGSGEGVYAQRYDAAGTPRGVETRVNTTTAEAQSEPSVAMDADGDYAVTWTSHLLLGGWLGVFAQRYDATGTPRGTETRISAPTSAPYETEVAMDADGDFVTTWTSDGQDGAGGGVYGRRFRGPETIDVALTQADNVDPIAVNGRVKYLVRVRNLAEPAGETSVEAIDTAIGAASGVYVLSSIPADATFISASGTGWTCTQFPASVRCRLAAPLPAGEVSTGLALAYQMPDTAQPALHPARVYENQLDPVSTNNSEVEQTDVMCSLAFAGPTFSTTETGSLTATITRTGSECGSSGVSYATSAATATAGADYTHVADTLTWAEGDTTKSFTVSLVDDGLDEGNEQLVLQLTGPTGALLATRSTATGIILDDDDPPRINFTTTSATAGEPGALLEVTLRLSEVSGRQVSVTLSKTGTATPGVDYFAPAKATIPAGQRSISFDVEIADDRSVESTEAANLILSSPVNATSGSLRTFRLIINDDD
ncbi:Calx-beta domain-containing protein [Nocardioides pelophilus]|uniref:Calx-beta domain-containing protein n=1 Tax=Nocardioides pelophilus TaxID=2172019 RepID=UPI001600CFB0|nr:Calx-beta domain-containing protein [Nocardioides pelophilus]